MANHVCDDRDWSSACRNMKDPPALNRVAMQPVLIAIQFFIGCLEAERKVGGGTPTAVERVAVPKPL